MQQADILVKKTDSMEKKGVWFIFCIVCHFFLSNVFFGVGWGGGGELPLFETIFDFQNSASEFILSGWTYFVGQRNKSLRHGGMRGGTEHLQSFQW